MTDRDVRDLIRTSFEGIVERHGVARSHTYACALELLAALDGQRIKLARPAHHQDPGADWRARDPAADAAAYQEAGQVGARAARAALYGTGTCMICRTPEVLLTRDGDLDEHDIPDDSLGPVGCVGAGTKPRAELAAAGPTPQTTDHTPETQQTESHR